MFSSLIRRATALRFIERSPAERQFLLHCRRSGAFIPRKRHVRTKKNESAANNNYIREEQDSRCSRYWRARANVTYRKLHFSLKFHANLRVSDCNVIRTCACHNFFFFFFPSIREILLFTRALDYRTQSTRTQYTVCNNLPDLLWSIQ